MATISKTVWLYRDGYPVKRFIGDTGPEQAHAFALDLRIKYPASVITGKITKLYEDDLFTFDPIREAKPKEMNDA